MSKLFFVIADAVTKVDNSAEYITYHTRYVTMSKRNAEMMMDFWQDELDSLGWLQKFVQNVKGFRIFELTVCEDLALPYIQDFHIHFRTLDISFHVPIGIEAMKYINVYLDAVYEKGLSEEPRMHKDRFNNKVVTIHE
jgi:hypothetical protein